MVLHSCRWKDDFFVKETLFMLTSEHYLYSNLIVKFYPLPVHAVIVSFYIVFEPDLYLVTPYMYLVHFSMQNLVRTLLKTISKTFFTS